MTIADQLHKSKSHKEGFDPNCPRCLSSTNMYDTSTLEGLRAWERSVAARPSLPPDVVVRTVMQRGDYSIVLLRDFSGTAKFSVRRAGHGGTAFGVAGGRGGDARLAWEDAYSWMRKRMREDSEGVILFWGDRK